MIRRVTGLVLEAVIGIAIAAVVVLSLSAALESAPFVYQGY